MCGIAQKKPGTRSVLLHAWVWYALANTPGIKLACVAQVTVTLTAVTVTLPNALVLDVRVQQIGASHV